MTLVIQEAEKGENRHPGQGYAYGQEQDPVAKAATAGFQNV